MPSANAFIENLAAALRGEPLAEKILLAPSHRVGRQWLDRAAGLLGGFANARTTTLRRLVRDYAEPELRRRNLRVLSPPERLRLMGDLLARVAGESGEAAYFTRLPPSLALVEALSGALEEVETASVRAGSVLADNASSPEKGAELAKLFRYAKGAGIRESLASAEDIHLAALANMAKAGKAFPLLLLPAGLGDDFTALEWAFIARWPVERRVRLDEGEDDIVADLSFFTADGPANEAREVLRRVQEKGLPLDRVEIVCLDAAVYDSVLCAAGLEMFGGEPEDLPITFNAGLPGIYARPVRLLLAWLEWLELGLPPEGLARMLDSGLLDDGWREAAPGISAARLAARLRALPINGEPDEYRRRLGHGGDSELAAAESWLAERVRGILPLGADGASLSLANGFAVLGAADKLLSPGGRRNGKLDAYAGASLLETIRAWLPHCDWPGFDPLAWLKRLADGLKVMGLGPMPGRLHVADLHSGGHSGRKHTFIVGLDDSRFPGGARQDPVLLDKERSGISPQLPKSGRRRQIREKALGRLLAGLRGSVVLSHARRDFGAGRELFPAAIFAKLAETRSGAVSERIAVLAPAARAESLDRRDDWLFALLSERPDGLDCAALASWFPNLAAGDAALRARESDAFTRYDGNVPEAGKEFDPRNGRVFSPTELETLAANPLDFFFRRAVGLKPPDRYAPPAGRWLEGNVRGTLVHDLFQAFLDRLDELGEAIDGDRPEEQRRLLGEMLRDAVVRYRRANPPSDILAFRREERELAEAADIFFRTEPERQRAARPLYREVMLGGRDEERTPWDRREPVRVVLPSGAELLLQGRVDRIDRLEGGGLVVIDYKTGGSGKFSRDDPFRQGRHLQPLLYTRMLESALNDMGKPEPVRGFSYFFPMPRDEGLFLTYDREMLDNGGMEIVARLESLLAGGRFPFTPDREDAKYSDYLPIYGDAAELAARSRAKAKADPALAGWAELRGIDT